MWGRQRPCEERKDKMARVSKIMVKQLPEQHMLTIRKTIDFFVEYSDFMGDAVGGILRLVEEVGAFPSSGPIVCFHNVELETLDVEVGFQVVRPTFCTVAQIEAKGDVMAQTVPVRTIAATLDRGPYEQQDPTLEELMKWIPEQGYEPEGGIYYHYLNGEEQSPSEYLTEMYIPVRTTSPL